MLKRMGLPNYYQVLGCTPSATLAQLRSNYYQLARKLHPDMGGNENSMAVVNEAWGVLRSAASREVYDKKRKLFTKLCLACKGAGVQHKQVGFTKRTSMVCTTCAGTGEQP